MRVRSLPPRVSMWPASWGAFLGATSGRPPEFSAENMPTERLDDAAQPGGVTSGRIDVAIRAHQHGRRVVALHPGREEPVALGKMDRVALPAIRADHDALGAHAAQQLERVRREPG